jgi:vacuolar-type H+-ATPase subunit H
VHWLTIFNQVTEGKAKLADAQNKAEQFRKDAAKELNKEVDKFDKTVEKKTSEAKSGISSWFGGK